MKYQDFKCAMNSYFLNTNNFTFNDDYFYDTLIIYIDNNRKLKEDIAYNNRRKITSIVWQGVIEFCGCWDISYFCLYPTLGANRNNYSCTSAQVKKYFKEFNLNYEIVLAPIIEHYENERKERQEEEKENKTR